MTARLSLLKLPKNEWTTQGGSYQDVRRKCDTPAQVAQALAQQGQQAQPARSGQQQGPEQTQPAQSGQHQWPEPQPTQSGQQQAGSAHEEAQLSQTVPEQEQSQDGEEELESPGPTDQTECRFCLGKLTLDGSCESLSCGHVFHTRCLEDYMVVTGKTRETACAFKCHTSARLLSAELAAAVAPPQPPSLDPALNPIGTESERSSNAILAGS